MTPRTSLRRNACWLAGIRNGQLTSCGLPVFLISWCLSSQKHGTTLLLRLGSRGAGGLTARSSWLERRAPKARGSDRQRPLTPAVTGKSDSQTQSQNPLFR